MGIFLNRIKVITNMFLPLYKILNMAGYACLIAFGENK